MFIRAEVAENARYSSQSVRFVPVRADPHIHHQRHAQRRRRFHARAHRGDELLLEVPEGAVEAAGRLVRHSMESVVELAVPLVVDLKKGANWAEMR